MTSSCHARRSRRSRVTRQRPRAVTPRQATPELRRHVASAMTSQNNHVAAAEGEWETTRSPSTTVNGGQSAGRGWLTSVGMTLRMRGNMPISGLGCVGRIGPGYIFFYIENIFSIVLKYVSIKQNRPNKNILKHICVEDLPEVKVSWCAP